MREKYREDASQNSKLSIKTRKLERLSLLCFPLDCREVDDGGSRKLRLEAGSAHGFQCTFRPLLRPRCRDNDSDRLGDCRKTYRNGFPHETTETREEGERSSGGIDICPRQSEPQISTHSRQEAARRTRGKGSSHRKTQTRIDNKKRLSLR